jgi:ADP-ribose pyrophosphatase YjhB (NUDIX family)
MKVPLFATHHCGVGSAVITEDKKILMVREKSKEYQNWKLPGGYINLGT